MCQINVYREKERERDHFPIQFYTVSITVTARFCMANIYTISKIKRLIHFLWWIFSSYKQRCYLINKIPRRRLEERNMQYLHEFESIQLGILKRSNRHNLNYWNLFARPNFKKSILYRIFGFQSNELYWIRMDVYLWN